MLAYVMFILWSVSCALLSSPGLSWTLLNSPELSWTLLDSPELSWIVYASLSLALAVASGEGRGGERMREGVKRGREG